MRYLLDTNIFYYLSNGALVLDDLPSMNSNIFYTSPIAIFELLCKDDTYESRLRPIKEVNRLFSRGMKLLDGNFIAIAQHFKVENPSVTNDYNKANLKWNLLDFAHPDTPRVNMERMLEPMKRKFYEAKDIWLKGMRATKENHIRFYSGNMNKLKLSGSSLRTFRDNKELFLETYRLGLSTDMIKALEKRFNTSIGYHGPVPSSFHPYTDVLMCYLDDLAETGRQPKHNDKADLTHFIYCNMPVDKIITADKYWTRVAKEAGYDDYLLIPSLRDK